MKKILIVDDKVENQYMLESLLKGEDFKVMAANNGIEALDLAHISPPDLIISDILMPGMDGFTLCKEWRNDMLLKKIPFIFYSAAYTNQRDIKYALRLGADRFLLKPQEPEEFLSEIKQVLHDFESGVIKPSAESEKNELEGLREYNSILFRKLEDKLFQIEINDRKLKRYSFELEQYIQKLKHAEELLQMNQNLLENISESYGIPYIYLNRKYVIEHINSAFESFTGYQVKDIIGKAITIFFQKNGEDSFQFMDNFEPVELPFTLKNGEIKNATLYFSSFIDKHEEEKIMAIVLGEDITEAQTVRQNNKIVKDHLEQKIKSRTIELEDSREQLRGLSSHLQNIREEERKHVAREIHDELGHLLTALKLDMEVLVNQRNDVTGIFKEKLPPLINIIDAAIDSVKTIATELRPAVLDNFGLLPALEWLIQQMRIRTTIEWEYEFDDLRNYDFSNEESTAIFRIFQEILTNVSRHSKATNVWITFKREKNSLGLRVRDNGIGFDVEKISKINSFGLLGMKERALSISGKLSIDSITDIGTTVILEINERVNNPKPDDG